MRLRSMILTSGIVLVFMGIGAGGCATSPPMAQQHIQLVRDHFAQFNDHDIEGMRQFVTDDVAWYSIEGDELGVSARGVEALVAGLTGYFAALPSVRAEIEHVHAAGSYAVARERVTWLDAEGNEKSQAAYSMYQMVDGKIESVWYFPAEE
jgi:hypothetical protein